MNDMEYKPNSHKSKEAQANQEGVPAKKFNKVVTGNVKTKKQGGLKNVTKEIISGDPVKVKSAMFEDVFIPAVKNLIEDLVVKGVRLFVRGDTGSRSGRTNAEYVSYNKMSDRRDVRRPAEPATSKLGRSYESICLESRGDAEEVLFRMKEALETYGMVSIADLWDLLGESHSYTEQKYGWTNLDSARVVSLRDGYGFDFPRAIPLT